MLLGSLREQLCYPTEVDKFSDDHLISVLNEVTFVMSPTWRPELLLFFRFRHSSACICAAAVAPALHQLLGAAPPHLIKKNKNNSRDSMAQRQRVGFQIQRLGVRIPLGSFLQKWCTGQDSNLRPHSRLRPERSALDRSATSASC